MKKLLLMWALVGIAAVAYAQVYPGQPQPAALVCAYNASTPVPTTGQFFYVQCDSLGRIIIQ